MPANIYSLSDLKNTSDDVIPIAMEKLGYRQSNRLVDVRLVLGYLGVIAAAIAGLLDYKLGFEKAKVYTLIGVTVYFICYGGMNYWQYFVERGTVYTGVKGASSIVLKTKTEQTAPQYNVDIAYSSASGHTLTRTKHELFTKWFDVDGNLVSEPLTTWLGLIVQECEATGKKKNK